MTEDVWDLLRNGRDKEALKGMEREYKEEDSAAKVIQMGVANLWLRKFSAAWKQFHDFNANYPLHASVTYGMEGVAEWCMNGSDKAVELWQTGMDSEFADAGVSIKLPLLLFFASVIKADIFPRIEAEKILVKQLRHRRATQWPGPLASYVIGRIDENRLREETVCKIDYELKDAVTLQNNWKADFYVGVVELARGNRKRYLEMMNKVANLTWADYDANKDDFLSKLWSEEFFLARHEISALQ